jgi:hypothetical protein
VFDARVRSNHGGHRDLNIVLQVNIRCHQVYYHVVGTIAYRSGRKALSGSPHLDAMCIGSGTQRQILAQILWSDREYDNILTEPCREHETLLRVGER